MKLSPGGGISRNEASQLNDSLQSSLRNVPVFKEIEPSLNFKKLDREHVSIIKPLIMKMSIKEGSSKPLLGGGGRAAVSGNAKHGRVSVDTGKWGGGLQTGTRVGHSNQPRKSAPPAQGRPGHGMAGQVSFSTLSLLCEPSYDRFSEAAEGLKTLKTCFFLICRVDLRLSAKQLKINKNQSYGRKNPVKPLPSASALNNRDLNTLLGATSNPHSSNKPIGTYHTMKAPLQNHSSTPQQRGERAATTIDPNTGYISYKKITDKDLRDLGYVEDDERKKQATFKSNVVTEAWEDSDETDSSEDE